MGLDHHRGGSGEPLVLIHGIGHTWRGWRPMLPRLEERFDVLAVDLPGFGHSEPFPAGIDSTPEALADAVEDEMARAGFDRAHFAGNSLGGWISLELARRGRAQTVTAISPAGLQHAREKNWGGGILRAIRWVSKNSPAPEPLMRQGRRFERLIPGAELRYIRGIGHTPMSDAPEELAEAIGEFALARQHAEVEASPAPVGDAA